MKCPIRLSTLALLMFFLGMVGALVWSALAPRGPIGGSREHHFGTVEIVGDVAPVKHVFTLVNQSNTTLFIEAIQPGCGCAVAQADAREVPAGEAFDVDVTLRLTHSGRKRTHVDLLLRDQGVVPLWIEAIGIKQFGLWPQQKRLRLSPDGPVPLVLIAEVFGHDAPATPELETPPGLDASFVAWEQLEPHDPNRYRSARWRGRVMVSGDGTVPAPVTSFSLRVPPDEPVDIMVTTPVTEPG